MTTPQITIIDGDDIIVRDMNSDEIAVYEVAQATFQEHTKAAADKATARQAVLIRLGITSDEANLLLS
jgi:hypothetical protein